jgi:osmotically-inducible protein OsmY
MHRNSDDIKLDIVDRLSRDSRLNLNSVKIGVKAGFVELSGSVMSFNQRDIVESDVWTVGGVIGVDNRIEVTFPSAFRRPSDESIRESVQKLLSWDPDIFLERIEAFVHEGVIILEGSVDSLWKKRRAEQLAGNTGGVLKVLNKIAVVLTNKMSDEKIGQDIISSLHRNSITDINTISVVVFNGQVTLTGIVPGRAVFDIAEDVARYSHGVTSVENRLRIA